MDTPLYQDSVAITPAIVSLGSQLAMEIIAESVESEQQANILKTTGCNEAQGYYYGRPIPAEHFCTADAEDNALILPNAQGFRQSASLR